MDFQIKRLNECCLGPRCQLSSPWEVEFTRRFLRSYCFCLTSSRKGSVFVISFLHFGISHLDLDYADCADLTWLPASQHPPPPPSPPPEPLYPLVWTRNNQSVVKIRYAIKCTCLFKVGVTPVKFRWTAGLFNFTKHLLWYYIIIIILIWRRNRGTFSGINRF